MDFKSTVIQLTQNGMGNGSEELGQLLAKNYFNLLLEENRLPRAILLYNSGVKIICQGSPAIEQLKQLEAKGVILIACKTCLNFYNIADAVQVGNTGTMSDILEMQTLANKVITL